MTRVDCQVFDEEAASWDRAAGQAGMTRHQWLRAVANKASAYDPDRRSAIQKKRLNDQLARLEE